MKLAKTMEVYRSIEGRFSWFGHGLREGCIRGVLGGISREITRGEVFVYGLFSWFLVHGRRCADDVLDLVNRMRSIRPLVCFIKVVVGERILCF